MNAKKKNSPCKLKVSVNRMVIYSVNAHGCEMLKVRGDTVVKIIVILLRGHSGSIPLVVTSLSASVSIKAPFYSNLSNERFFFDICPALPQGLLFAFLL